MGGGGMDYDCAGRTHVGLRRKINEDRLLSLPDRGLWVVADGMGGHDAGEVASGMLVDRLGRLAAEPDLARRVEGAVAAVVEVNHQLIELARSDMSPRTIGSTVVGVAIEGDQFRCFWAGDSRAYRLRAGRIKQLSKDHSLVQGLVEAGMLSPEEAPTHPNANVITRAVGVIERLVVDMVSGDVRAGDIFLLGSDGLTRLVDDEELAMVIGGLAPGDAADRLIDRVLERGAPDNVTLVIVRIV